MKYRVVVSLVTLLLATAAVGGIYVYKQWYQSMTAIDTITRNQYGHNKFFDVNNTIEVSEPEDLGYKIEDSGDITLYYGKQIIEIKKHSMKEADFMKKLEAIGIEIKTNDKGEYKITYWGDEITEWEAVY